MTDQDQVIICEVVDTEGKPVFNGLSRTYQVTRDGSHEGTRGNVHVLRKLTDKPLKWDYQYVILEETGERVRRSELAASG